MSTKFDTELAQEAQQWIESVTGESFKDADFQESLKDGVLLCKVLNKLAAGTVGKINTSKMPFMQMENIAAYIAGSKKLGVPDEYNFMTVDLYEGKNLAQVVQNILTLKRRHGGGFQQLNKATAFTPTVEGLEKRPSSDQTTSSKDQTHFLSRDPTKFESEEEISRVGSAFVSGRSANDAAMKCPVCTKFITSGAVNAVGKTWHTNCFTCGKCGVKLSTAKYYEHQSKPYCERCILIVKPQTSVKAVSSSNLAEQKGFKF